MKRDAAIAAPVVPASFERAGAAAVFWQRWRASSPALWWTGWLLLLLSLPTLSLTLFDGRELNGISVWIKPWKFQLSVGVYLLTLSWALVWLPPALQRGRAATWVAWLAVGTALFEVGYITWQAAWGRASHFNVATPYDATMYALMGVAAVLLSSAALVFGVLVLRCRTDGLSQAMRHAVGWGLVLTFVLGTGFGAWLSSSQTGHWVGGLPTDAGGMPLTGWSRTGGDLRVAHFFGVHAVHFLVAAVFLLEWAVARTRVAWPATSRLAGAPAVWLLAAAYCLLATASFVQALRGEVFLG